VLACELMERICGPQVCNITIFPVPTVFTLVRAGATFINGKLVE
jgi:hypothetical protein